MEPVQGLFLYRVKSYRSDKAIVGAVNDAAFADSCAAKAKTSFI
jgi:hypothetical protein